VNDLKPIALQPVDLQRVDWDKGAGLVPAIVQDVRDGRVLMLGYMNREALQRTQETRRVTFYSRSRARLWEKGETSGHGLELRAIRLDCDGDTLLISALPEGPVCHTGTATCFGDDAPASVPATAPPATEGTPADLAFVTQLEQLIARRIAENPEGSYTARLYRSGVRRVAQKVGEEGLEVALAGCVEGDDALLGESADLVYHLLVLLRARSLSFEQVVELLRSRHESTISTAGSRKL
jgi:phosphoribosyl-ATP pyrophosphohydrolase/phosphoribosyl-AMP cyclohydrolase